MAKLTVTSQIPYATGSENVTTHNSPSHSGPSRHQHGYRSHPRLHMRPRSHGRPLPNGRSSPKAGMTACCGLKPDNAVHMAGPDGCALWCLIPDEFLFEQTKNEDGTTKNGKRRDGTVAASAMEQCVEDKGNVTGPYITIWQVKEGAAAAAATAWSGKMSLKTVVGTVAWGLVVVGLLA
ncbi:hypothetical protein B0H65DRAFT_77791 [Neurospora tetraspora]|uniref:Uncharacterized protein n=1 Tax=Neurospora tetraspora TaxID=94610 RepID=A0AAE0MJP0_9PEZI|nr:hypothetical protein B0H65DRAFT_77791 [Neurospora tetraspora]